MPAVIGTSLGMMGATYVPAVLLDDRAPNRTPVRLVHTIAAAIFPIPGAAKLPRAGARPGLLIS